MLVPDRRTLIVLASLVGAMTIASGLLLLLEPGPTMAMKGMSLSTVERQVRAGGGLFNASGQSKSGRWSTLVIHYGSVRPVMLRAVNDIASRRRASESAYHFVVRSAAASWDDRLEISHRWHRQMAGAYWAGPESQWVNHHRIGICVESDPSGQGPNEKQLQKLIWLAQRLQTEFQIPADRVILQVDAESASSAAVGFRLLGSASNC